MASSLVSSPGRDSCEEKSLRDNALKTMGKAAQNPHHRLHLDVETKVSKDSLVAVAAAAAPSTPVVNVKEILEEQPKDGVDPRHRMLLKNAIQLRGNRRFVGMGIFVFDLFSVHEILGWGYLTVVDDVINSVI